MKISSKLLFLCGYDIILREYRHDYDVFPNKYAIFGHEDFFFPCATNLVGCFGSLMYADESREVMAADQGAALP